MMGGTAGKIKCSDWPTKPPVIDACLLISSLEKNPDLEPKQKEELSHSSLDTKFNIQ